MEFYAKYSGEVELGVLRSTRTGGDTREPARGYTINVLVPRPEPMPLSIESGDARPKLAPPGSAPVVEGRVISIVVIPPAVSQNGADHQAVAVPNVPVLKLCW